MSNKKESSTKQKRRLRGIAHHLDPVVTVADQGLTDAVVKETCRALKDHELIKVKLALSDKTDRKAIADELAKQCKAQCLQLIGKVGVFFKENPEADPRLSNLQRYE